MGTAAPQCALQDSSSGDKYCALICSPSSNDAQCGTNASCKSIQGTGLCTYDDDVDTNKATTVKYNAPADVTAAPQCALQDSSSGDKYCALICSPSSNDESLRAGDAQCGGKGSCKAIQTVGV